MQTKDEVRSSLKLQAKQFLPTSFLLEDKASVESLLKSTAYAQCTTVFAFSPLAIEVDISPVLKDALMHKRLALPRCIGDTMEFFFVTEGWDDTAKPSGLGVLEPLGGKTAIPDEYSLILVPAMAYTTDGVRLGRGKGYYDRFLGQYTTTPTLGICRRYQLLKYIPTELWDIRVREVLCNGVIYRT